MAQKSKSDDATKVAQYMIELIHPMKSSIEALRKIIKAVHPDITERIKWNAPSYQFNGVDFLTFGPPVRKQNEILLVFHHPDIVTIDSDLLEGKYIDRRLITLKSESECAKKVSEISRVIECLIHKIS